MSDSDGHIEQGSKALAAPRTTTAASIGGADPKEVAAWSENLPDSFLLCRDMGHTWRPFRAYYSTELHAYERVLRCGRCKTERKQSIAENGLILSGSYDYPDGYTAPAGTGRIDGNGRGALRLESVLRLIGKDEKDK